jgi:catechol 2,3-dioxygenase-like lactoylglutathione lyase family enzyme
MMWTRLSDSAIEEKPSLRPAGLGLGVVNRQKEETMIKRLSQAGVPVLDQDSAKAFYTEKLGFEVRADETMDGFRWLTVSPTDQPDFDLILWSPGPPMQDEETAQQIRALVAKGAMSGGVWGTDDIKKTFEKLSAKGVVFLQEPVERPYGIEAVFRDDSGNWFSLSQPS